MSEGRDTHTKRELVDWFSTVTHLNGALSKVTFQLMISIFQYHYFYQIHPSNSNGCDWCAVISSSDSPLGFGPRITYDILPPRMLFARFMTVSSAYLSNWFFFHLSKQHSSVQNWYFSLLIFAFRLVQILAFVRVRFRFSFI